MRAIRAKMHDLCLIFPYPQDANSVKRDRDCRLQSASVFHARRRIFFVFCTLATRKDLRQSWKFFLPDLKKILASRCRLG